MFLVGLTGGIGSGKSLASRRFVERGATVIDADQISREVVEPGQPALAELADRFGPSILRSDGTLNRQTLADLAFASDEAHSELEAITHPHIAARLDARLAEAQASVGADHIVILEHPLLIETGQHARVDQVVVVLAGERVRMRRLIDIRGMAETDARARLSAQTTDEVRRAVATYVLDNDGSPDQLVAAVDEVYDQLVAAARDRTDSASQTPPPSR